MAIDVSEEVVAKTTLCESDFACLSSDQSRMCRVQRQLMKESLVIDCVETRPCRYRLSFGNWCICSCPTRKEIYERYAL